MKDLNKDGILEIEIPLDPGRYEYKFFVDGKEMVEKLMHWTPLPNKYDREIFKKFNFGLTNNIRIN